MIQIKAAGRSICSEFTMIGWSQHQGDADDDAQDGQGRVRRLRDQADRCVELATRAFHPRMFQKYLDLAAAYQQEAAAIEQHLDATKPAPETELG